MRIDLVGRCIGQVLAVMLLACAIIDLVELVVREKTESHLIFRLVISVAV
jgi:hypothetical protein